MTTILTGKSIPRRTVLKGLGAGLALPFLAAGWSIEAFFRVFRRVRRHFRASEVASGAMLMGVGGLLVSGEFDDLNRRFSFMADWVTSAERLLQ